MKRFMLSYFFFVMILILVSCNSGDSALFNGSEYEGIITIDAHLTLSLDSSSPHLKTDTLVPGDSVIFMVSVYPSKAIRLQNYYWKINEKKRGTEFSFRSAFEEAGKQTAVFHLVDFYGDTLTDTLIIWISTPPQLNDSVFIPAKGSQKISSEKGISFIWSANDPDANDPLKHHFRLYSNETSYVDTMIQESYFNYFFQLPPLQQFYWSVETFDSFNFKAPQKIESSFFTKSLSSEDGAVMIPISSNNNLLFSHLEYQITPKSGQPLPLYILEKKNTFLDKGYLYLTSLKEGSYEIEFFQSKYTDFKIMPIPFSIKKEEVLLLDSVYLSDSISPLIYNLNSNSDTVYIQDTLQFLIVDRGLPLTKNHIQIYFDSELFQSWTYSDSLVLISIPKEKQNDFWHLLSFKIIDYSMNITKQTFFLSPLPLSE